MTLDERISKAMENQDFSYCIELMEQRDEARRRLRIQEYCRDHSNKKNTIETIKDYVFITFNPPDDVAMKDFVEYMSRVSKKKWIEKYLYVFEQRTENLLPPWTGRHCHMLIKHIKGKSHAHIIREIKNSVKQLLNTDNTHLLNIKFIDEAEFNRKIKYLVGSKSDVEKHAKQAADKPMRAYYEIPAFYAYNIERKRIYDDIIEDAS